MLAASSGTRTSREALLITQHREIPILIRTILIILGAYWTCRLRRGLASCEYMVQCPVRTHGVRVSTLSSTTCVYLLRSYMRSYYLHNA